MVLWNYSSDLKLELNTGCEYKEDRKSDSNEARGISVSTLYFTNIAKANFDRACFAEVTVKYTKDGKTYSKMGAYVDQNSVSSIAEKN